MREDWFILGASAHLPDVRRDVLLRQLAQQACHQTCARHRASSYRLRAAWRTLALLLSRRRLFGILERFGQLQIRDTHHPKSPGDEEEGQM
jgi:hypothetical protein